MPTSEHKVTHSPLGKSVDYHKARDASDLFAIPRQQGRNSIGISGAELPFHGEDVWNAYELSWLDALGKPVVALGRFRFPASTPNLIESKSLKLYLNGFNQRCFDSASAISECIRNDLSSTSGGTVSVEITPLSERPQRGFDTAHGILLDEQPIAIDTYDYQPDFLVVDERAPAVEERLQSNLLKSNCLVTDQPDWGSLYIHYRGRRIDHAGLLRYIVSFRQHNEFHEQCVERIFCDIRRLCRPEELTVWARYTRRGGLDINPLRSSDPTAMLDATWEIRQ